ncbi:hypothetical protein PUN28_015085 [Cardiocondyla obscurior]|uniref:Uncharacterized protein n=1 Tax=Cardiocondyla obscurior TaxID=286306 RepID=A0AAW2EZH6_9HYME
MKRVALYALALIAIVVADDKGIDDIAKKYDSEPKAIEECLAETGITTDEIYDIVDKFEDVKEDSFSGNMKESLAKYSLFLSCILKKNGMIVDSKLVVDKIIENIDKSKDDGELANKEGFKECLIALNEAEMSQEDRVFGLMLCAVNGQG